MNDESAGKVWHKGKEINLTVSALQRFWGFIEQRGIDECWPWIGGAKATFGYGRFCVPGRSTMMAHRIVWMLTNGQIPDATPCVLHDCPTGDNPACCNPAHLWLGTLADNHLDCCAKRRHSFGSLNGRAKLTPELVLAIRREHQTTIRSYTRLAKKYGVGRTTIFHAVHDSWKHV